MNHSPRTSVVEDLTSAVVDLPVLGPTRITVSATGLREILLGRSEPALAPSRAPAGFRPWIAVLREWSAGHPIPDDLPLDLADRTEFQRLVLIACRAIPFGRVVSYGGLATIVGRPAAARAVGGVMARNPVPVVIPCHRVVGSSGVGGFSPGLALKRRMWVVEGIPWPGTSVR